MPVLFHQLQIQGDAHPIHQHLALVDQLLIGDFGIGKVLVPRSSRLFCPIM